MTAKRRELAQLQMLSCIETTIIDLKSGSADLIANEQLAYLILSKNAANNCLHRSTALLFVVPERICSAACVQKRGWNIVGRHQQRACWFTHCDGLV